MKSTANPQAKAINQKRGPTTGNQSAGTKRKDFEAAKSKSGSDIDLFKNTLSQASLLQHIRVFPALSMLNAVNGYKQKFFLVIFFL